MNSLLKTQASRANMPLVMCSEAINNKTRWISSYHWIKTCIIKHFVIKLRLITRHLLWSLVGRMNLILSISCNNVFKKNEFNMVIGWKIKFKKNELITRDSFITRINLLQEWVYNKNERIRIIWDYWNKKLTWIRLKVFIRP